MRQLSDQQTQGYLVPLLVGGEEKRSALTELAALDENARYLLCPLLPDLLLRTELVAQYLPDPEALAMLIGEVLDVRPEWLDATCDGEQTSLLTYAILGGHEAVVLILIERGANLAARDLFGNLAIEYAPRSSLRSKCIEQILDLMLSKGILSPCDQHHMLYESANHSRASLCNLLVARGADTCPRGLDECGQSTVMMAAGTLNFDTLLLLQASGAGITKKNLLGQNALHYLACGQDFDYEMVEQVVKIALFLMDHGCDPYQADTDGCTPISIAEYKGLWTLTGALQTPYARATLLANTQKTQHQDEVRRL